MYVKHRVIYNHYVIILALSAPTYINIGEVTSTTVEVTWDKLDGATGYTISYTITDSGNDVKTKQVDGGDTTISTLKYLKENTTYDITVEGRTGYTGEGRRNAKSAVEKVTTGKWHIAILSYHAQLTLKDCTLESLG